MKKIGICLVSIICMLIISACSPVGFPVKIFETEISSPPKRVVCLSESTAELLLGLGYKENVVGAPQSVITSENLSATDIGTPLTLYDETIISLKPDLIITSFEIKASLKNLLEQNSVAVVVLQNPNSVEQLKNLAHNVFKIFRGEKKSAASYDSFCEDFGTKISELKGKNISGKKALVYIEKGFVATGDSLISDAITQIGFVNIAAQKTGFVMDSGEIAEKMPEVVFCPKGMGNSVMQNEAFKDTPAIKNGAVYEVNVLEVLNFGSGFFGTLEEMVNLNKK